MTLSSIFTFGTKINKLIIGYKGIMPLIRQILKTQIQKGGDNLKATGIVRRIDDLGRVVIPKEIRRTMRIREGDPLEIYTDNDGEVIFKKYSPVGELSHFANQYAEVLSKTSGCPVLISDRDVIVSSFGISRKESVEHRISDELESALEQRKPYIYDGTHKIMAAEGIDKPVLVAMPILAAGDLTGTVVMLQGDNIEKPSETDIKLASAAASFLAKQKSLPGLFIIW
jgi:AbrB family transcriptional regulator (stage V sporulation protein T)